MGDSEGRGEPMNRRTKWMKNTRNLIMRLQVEIKTKNEEQQRLNEVILQLQTEMKKVNALALYYKTALMNTQDRARERSWENSERREILAKVLSININCEAWWDISDEKKDVRILEAIKALKDRVEEKDE